MKISYSRKTDAHNQIVLIVKDLKIDENDVGDAKLINSLKAVMLKGGLGGGFYNVDNEHPLSSGHYTLTTAVAAVANDENIDAKTKNGMAITFYSGTEWKVYRYLNVYDPESETADSDFANVDNWEAFGSSSDTDTRMKRIDDTILGVGDMLFYDKIAEEYVVVKKAAVASVLSAYDTVRYETNYDTFVGTLDGQHHFVARDDSMPTQSLYGNDVAATSCYYRIEIDNTSNGSITFSATSGNGSIASTTISWEANATMSDIVALFTAKNTSYLTFGALTDGKGVGLEAGGYGTNTLTVTDSSNCTVIDCSTLAFYRSENPAAPAVGGTFNVNANWQYINNSTHNNFRGAAAASILTGKNLVAASNVLIAIDGYNYSCRCGGNFAKFKSWASTLGESTYYDDGEDEQTGANHVANPMAHVMNEATFNTGVRDFVAVDPKNPTSSELQHLGMKDYYTHLYTDATGDYATLRTEYEAKYGQMTSMYDAYLMSHMIDPAANSGITNSMRNKGKHQTEVNADAMNVTYNYVIIPAYPPEYNASIYGNAATIGFKAGNYYHPEPADLGLMLRDDIMPIINANIAASSGGTQLNNTTSRGSCAEYDANSSWYFNGTYGCINNSTRDYTHFRCRPVLALPVSN